MRVKDQKLALSQLPGIIDTDNAVGVLPATVHDRASDFLEMVADGLTLLYDLFAVADVKDPAIEVGEMLDHPGDFCCADPLPRVSEFLPRTKVDAIDQLLDLSDGQHLRQLQVILQVEPRKQGLQTPVSAAPAMIVEILISIMEVLIQASSVVLYVLILLDSSDEEMRVEQLLRRKGDQLRRKVDFATVELFDQSICSFVDLFLESIFGGDVEVKGQGMIE